MRFPIKADSLGVISSLLCLIHCVMLPIMVVGGIVHEDWGGHTHTLDYVFVALALVAVFFATRHSHSKKIRVGLWVGIGWFSVSILLHDVSPIALYSSVLASCVLVLLHVLNFRSHHLAQHQ